MPSKCSSGGYLNEIVMNMENKIIWSKPNFDFSFVEKNYVQIHLHWCFSHVVGARMWDVSMASERVGLVMETSCQQCVRCRISHSMLEFPLMPSMTDVWEVWQCPSHTLETEMRRCGARSRGTRQEWTRRCHPAIYSQWAVARRWTEEVVPHFQKKVCWK